MQMLLKYTHSRTHACAHVRTHTLTPNRPLISTFVRWSFWLSSLESLAVDLSTTGKHTQTDCLLSASMCKHSSAGDFLFFFLTPTSASITATPLADTDAPLLLSSRIVPAEAGEDSQISTGRCNTKADWVQNYRRRSKPLLSLSGPCLMTWEVIGTLSYFS